MIMSTGLPRYSALPTPRSGRQGSIDSAGSSGSTGLPAPSGRMSAASNQLPESLLDSRNAPLSPQNNRRSMLMQPGHIKSPSVARSVRPQSMMVGLGGFTGLQKSPPRVSDDVPETVQEVDTPAVNGINKTPVSRRPRPSLSDRTIESLSQVPPSPSPAKQRRQSAFYRPESPKGSRPQSRAGSSLGMVRPGSRIGGPSGTMNSTLGRPASPSKRPTTAGSLKQPSGLTAPGRRAVSDRPAVAVNGIGRSSSTLKKPASGLQQPARTTGLVRPGAGRVLAAPSKTVGARPSGVRSPVKDLFGPEIPKPATTALSAPKSLKSPAVKQIRPLQTSKAPGIRAPGSRVLPKTRSSASSIGDVISPTSPVPPSLGSTSGDETTSLAARTEDQFSMDEIASVESLPIPEDLTPRRVPSTSKGLRDMIAAGRAARKTSSKFAPRAASNSGDFGGGIGLAMGPDTDPNSFDMEDSRFVNVLKKRINTAKTEGKLNISALGLTEVPVEVIKMYDYSEGGVAFYEMVDVTRLQAADNEIQELPNDAFPPLPEDGVELEGQPAFCSLESIDFHGNKLQSLPARLAGLDRLTSLNFSQNRLDFDSLEIISRLPSLVELKLAENGLKGALPACIGNLTELESLDIHSNNITELPQEIGKLNKLRRLNVLDNRLERIPFEAIFDLPIIEIIASRNKLSGALFANHVTQAPHLQILDVSINALVDISEEKIALPKLQSLNISNNRVAALPNVSDWKELTSLNVEENKISAFPEGFVGLTKLKTANFSNNSLLAMDDRIGEMDNLVTLQLANNPIRERKFVRFSTEELKSELRMRLQASSQEQQPDSASPSKARFNLVLGGANGASVIGPGPAWTAASGWVEKSGSKLRDIEAAQIESLVGQGVHTLSLHHNWLPQIPATIGLLGASLTTLDLSNNRLNKTDPFVGGAGQPLHLPNLVTLNLTSNGLTTLDPLVNGGLLAPVLATLIVPFNRLTRLPTKPSLRDAFPQLTKLIAANNVIDVLDVEAVRGLQVLDVSSNEVGALPPQLGNLQGTLRTLMVNGNRFKVPGWGVVEKGTEEVLKWCRMKIPAGEEGSMVTNEEALGM